MNKIFKKNKIIIILAFIIALFVLSFNIIGTVQAEESGSKIRVTGDKVVTDVNDEGSNLARFLSWIVLAIIQFVGTLLTWVTGVVVGLFKVVEFTNIEGVKLGWAIVRDLCNMFFILGLLVIAFATILRVESYSLKTALPKLIIAAIVINFSRTICGLFIDFSQIITLTFASGISNGASFVQGLQIDKIISLRDESGFTFESYNLLSTFLLALLLLVIALFVMIMFAFILLGRIIMFWILTILSPLAFFAYALPGTKQIFSRWWGEFSKYLIVGPVIAFFTWLSLKISVGFSIAAAGGSNISGFVFNNPEFEKINFLSKIATWESLSSYLISIGLLVGTLKITQDLSVIGGNVGMDLANRAKSLSFSGAKKTFGLGLRGAAGFGSWGARKIKLKTGWELNPVNIYRGAKEALQEKKRKEKDLAEVKSATALREGGVKGLLKGLGASHDLVESLAHGVFYKQGFKKARATVRVGRLRKEKRKLQEAISKEVSEEEREAIQNRINKVDEELETISTPFTFVADQKRNAAIREAMSKIGDTDNGDELNALFKDAIDRGDQEMASAVMLSASRVGGLNDLIEAQKSKYDLKDYEYGDIKEGDYLPAGGYGLNELVKQKLIKDLGMDEQTAYSLQSQASALAKAAGQYNLAESVGVKNGKFFQRSHKEQQMLARGELAKVDREKIWREHNRLSHGEEIPIKYIDKKTGEKKVRKKFVINDLGKNNLLETAKTLKAEIDGRGRINTNYLKNLVGEDGEGKASGLKAYLLSPEMKDKVYDYDKTGKPQTYGGLYHDIVNFAANITGREGSREDSKNKKSSSKKTKRSGTSGFDKEQQ